MKDIERRTTKQLEQLLDTTNDEIDLEQIYDELERRERYEETRDHTEEDAQAAWSERLEMYRNEY